MSAPSHELANWLPPSAWGQTSTSSSANFSSNNTSSKFQTLDHLDLTPTRLELCRDPTNVQAWLARASPDNTSRAARANARHKATTTSSASLSTQQTQISASAPAYSPPTADDSHEIVQRPFASSRTTSSSSIPSYYTSSANSPADDDSVTESTSTTYTSSRTSAKKNVRLGVVEKRQMCEEYVHTRVRQKDLSIKYGVERSTVSKILKEKEAWLVTPSSAGAANVSTSRQSTPQISPVSPPRKLCRGRYPLVEELLIRWGRTYEGKFTDDLVRGQARTIAQSLGVEYSTFKASSGWLENFKARTGYRSSKFGRIASMPANTPKSSQTTTDGFVSPGASTSASAQQPLNTSSAWAASFAMQPNVDSQVSMNEADAVNQSSSGPAPAIIAPRPMQVIKLEQMPSFLMEAPPMISPALSFGSSSEYSYNSFGQAPSSLHTPYSVYPGSHMPTMTTSDLNNTPIQADFTNCYNYAPFSETLMMPVPSAPMYLTSSNGQQQPYTSNEFLSQIPYNF